MGYDVCVLNTIHTDIVRFFDLPFVVLIQKRKAIVRQSYVSADSTYISYGSRALSVRSPYIRFDTKRKEAAR